MQIGNDTIFYPESNQHTNFFLKIIIKVRSNYGPLAYFSDIFISGKNVVFSAGWRHFVDNDISWTLFFKVGDFSWTFPKGDFSWTLLVTSRGQF